MLGVVPNSDNDTCLWLSIHIYDVRIVDMHNTYACGNQVVSNMLFSGSSCWSLRARVTGGVGRRWCGCCRTELEVRIEGQESEYVSKSDYCLLYKRTSKERRKGNPPTLSTLSLYTIHLPPSNHPSCSDVPSESHTMILHTTPLFLYRNNHATSPDVATPQTTSLSY